jgi:uncharacterized protein YidB (DUF937 family)
MTDIRKLSTLLDNPEARELIFALGKADKVRAVVLDLAVTAGPEQYRSWLDDDVRNQPMSAALVRQTLGDAALAGIAAFTSSTSDAVAWQLSELLPDLVDAATPGGQVLDAPTLAAQIAAATLEDEREEGAFAG